MFLQDKLLNYFIFILFRKKLKLFRVLLYLFKILKIYLLQKILSKIFHMSFRILNFFKRISWGITDEKFLYWEKFISTFPMLTDDHKKSNLMQLNDFVCSSLLKKATYLCNNIHTHEFYLYSILTNRKKTSK